MTSRERVEAALHHAEPDRTPMFEYVLLSPVAGYILGRNYVDYTGDMEKWIAFAREAGWENAVRQYAVDRAELAAKLGHDMLYVVPCPPAAAVAERHGPAMPPDSDKLPCAPEERVMRRNEKREQASPPPPDDIFLVYALIREELAKRDLDLPILAPAYAHGVWTDVDLMQTMLLAPDVAHRHFALATESALGLIARYLELDLDMMGVGGDFAGNRPIISPAAYREFIVPEVRKLSDRIHSAGKRAINASDGNLWDVIDDFLTGCGVDGYLEIDKNTGMDLRRLKAAYGDAITFLGNMDCGAVLSHASPLEIRRQTVQCLEDGAGRGGHIFCASNAITESVPLENYLAMAQAYREHFGLPQLIFH